MAKVRTAMSPQVLAYDMKRMIPIVGIGPVTTSKRRQWETTGVRG
ncbi:hypothetical protein [Methylobacterium planeticum]